MPDLAVDADLGGYLAVPSGDGPWPGVIVLHEAYGLNDDVRRNAELLAEAGYLAFAPDLYRGGSGLRCLLRAFRELNARRGRTFDDIESARAWLVGRADCTGRAGVIGFCIGGGFALLAASRPGFNAASVNYGMVPDDVDELLRGACPVVASFGGRDRSLRGAAATMAKALSANAIQHDVKEYPGAGHGFLNQHTPPAPIAVLAKVLTAAGYQDEAARDAWQRITGFFAEHLAPAD